MNGLPLIVFEPQARYRYIH
ncbi:hypothetical protein [Geobacillus thermoleovorans]